LPTLRKYSKNVPENDSAHACRILVERTYTEIDDPNQVEIPEARQTRAYNYGKQLVPVSAENEKVLKLGSGTLKKNDDRSQKGRSGSTSPRGNDGIKMQQGGVEKCFKLLGFTSQDSVARHHFMGGVDVVLPVKGSKNERAFAALVDAMIGKHRVLIAKIVERKNADPKLVVLHPHISKKQPLLYLAQVPTAEDLRDFQFPSLVQSTNKQRQAASDLIDKLDLCAAEEDAEGEQVIEEKLQPEKTFNPTIQYFNQVITHKVVNPEQAGELPRLNSAIERQMERDQELFEHAKDAMEEFDEAFELTNNAEEREKMRQTRKRVYWRDIIEQEE